VSDTVNKLNAVLAPVSDKSAPQRGASVLDPPDENAPEFEFYDILPQMEVVIPPEELETVGERQTSFQYLLQVGSFASREDADKLKARCTLLGFEPQIVPVRIDERVWYRVRIGPFDRARDTDIARRRLFDNNIESIVLREDRAQEEEEEEEEEEDSPG
jgi:cell division protein FtsN